MKKMKEKVRDKIKEKKGCVPEIVAIKKTRIIPVAVPVRSSQPAYDDSPPPSSYSSYPPAPQPAAKPAPSNSNRYPGPPPPSYGPSTSGGSGGYAMGGGHSAGGYDDDDHDDDDDDEHEGYDEHEESYGHEGHAEEGHESYEHEDDDEYRRRSGNESLVAEFKSTSSPVIEYTSLVSGEASSNFEPLDDQPQDRHSERRRMKREPDREFWAERRLIPRFRRSLSHPASRWRVSGSVFFMQQGFW